MLTREEFRRAEQAVWLRRTEKLSAPLRSLLNSAESIDEQVDLLVTYAPPAVPKHLARSAASTDFAEARAAHEEIFHLHDELFSRMNSYVDTVGGRAVQGVPGFPALFTSLAISAVKRLAEHPQILLVELKEFSGFGGELADPVPFHDIDVTFNDPPQNIFGNNIPVGLVELNVFDGVRIADHESQELLSGLAYELPLSASPTCPCIPGEICSGTFCRATHGARVLSVISASEAGVARAAGKVDLHIPNNDKVCDADGAAGAYSWLFGESVYTINESYFCVDGANSMSGVLRDGRIQDYYARQYGMLTVRAAGNEALSGDSLLEPACPNTLNSLCVGGVTPTKTMWPESDWKNPPGQDREEPDLVALGEDVRRALPGASRTAWADGDGTSLASPAVTGMVAMYRERCSGSIPFAHQNQIRAVFRNLAFSADADSMGRYSTPAPAAMQDFKDGAGFLSAGPLLYLCGGEPPGGLLINQGLVTIDMAEDGTDMPGGSVEYQAGYPFDETADYTSAPDAASREGHLLFSLGTLDPGDRVRFSISWSACVSSPTGGALTTAGSDFDLFLYKKPVGGSGGKYIFGSQSVDDVNEGFDVTLTSSHGSGDYEIWVSWESGSTCAGHTIESLGWSSARW